MVRGAISKQGDLALGYRFDDSELLIKFRYADIAADQSTTTLAYGQQDNGSSAAVYVCFPCSEKLSALMGEIATCFLA